MNNKAASWPLIALIGVILLVTVIGGAFLMGDQSGNTTGPVTVQINQDLYNSNLTDSHVLDWGAISLGNTYTKNFSVTNNDNQDLYMQLLTTEPAGTIHEWIYNGTMIPQNSTIHSTLQLSVGTMASTGSFTWKFFATNTTIVEPTPTPSPTPIPVETLTFTINADMGVETILITNNAGSSKTLTREELQTSQSFNFTTGDDLIFETTVREGFSFDTWDFDDGTWNDVNPIILTNVQEAFVITATYTINPTPSPEPTQ